MRKDSLWSNEVFEEEVIFHVFDFKTSGLKIKYLKAHNFVWQGCFFLSLLSRNFDNQLSSNFHRFVVLCICWDTASEKTGLWQLPLCPLSLIKYNSVTYGFLSNLYTLDMSMDVVYIKYWKEGWMFSVPTHNQVNTMISH